jgi:hypothetical protein
MGPMMSVRPGAGGCAGDGVARPPTWLVWVRSCTVCGEHDLTAAFGHPTVVDDLPWTCTRCPSSTWELRQVPLP